MLLKPLLTEMIPCEMIQVDNNTRSTPSRKRGEGKVKARKSHMLMPLYGPSLFCASSNVKSLTAFHKNPRPPTELDIPEEKKYRPFLKNSRSMVRNRIQGMMNNTNKITLSIHTERGTKQQDKEPTKQRWSIVTNKSCRENVDSATLLAPNAWFVI